MQLNRILSALERAAEILFILALIAGYIWLCSKSTGGAQTFMDINY